jgi:tetrahydromethanopterin S-methyltransferase subunit E
LRIAIKAFLLAVLIAAVVATFAAYIHALASSWIEEGTPPSISALDLRLLVAVFLSFIVFSFLSLALFCVPLTVVLSRFQLERPWTYPLLGCLVGFVVAVIFSTPIGEPYNSEIFRFQLVAGALPGSVAGFVWWRSYRKMRARADSTLGEA